MLSHNASNKAQRYLSLLDQARCEGNWEEVSRLRLKIVKHLPQRKCLQVIVGTECMLSTRASEPLSTSSSLPSPDYIQQVPEILTALKYGNPTTEDTFQAEVCLSWLHWIINEPTLALSRLPTNLETFSRTPSLNGEILAGWTHVCVVKGAYVRGVCQENTGNLPEAVRGYESILPYVMGGPSTLRAVPEYRIWTQRLLSRYCMLSNWHVRSNSQYPKNLLSSSSLISPARLLAPFRAWNDFWEAHVGQPKGALAAKAGNVDFSHLRVWQAYYETFSTLLQLEATYPSLSLGSLLPHKEPLLYESKFFSKPKSEQWTEFTKVQSMVHKLLMLELSFPQAHQPTPEIENWTDQVIANWKILCGSTWRDEDFVDSGKETTGRIVLDILYEAATKSFHSTRILRHLFTVHSSLADFYLANKALDSYIQIVLKGKARVEKSGGLELGLDDDSMAIVTASAGINMLCKYGRRKDAERAQELAEILEKWLYQLCDKENNESLRPTIVIAKESSLGKAERQALAAGFCALGISQARWADLTYETSLRVDLQSRAISNLQLASGPNLGNENSFEILYPLALVLAKTRDIDLAITVLKNGLSNGASDQLEGNRLNSAIFEFDSFPNTYQRRLLLKSWHLLALLLSAKQTFSTAVTSCEAAVELYGFYSGSSEIPTTQDPGQAVELCDKQNIIETKLTQLALTEVIDGPEEAVSACEELLGLYATLFNYTEKQATVSKEPEPESPPVSRHGTIKSFRESFLGRSKGSRRRSIGSVSIARNFESGSLASQELPKAIARTPTISVTSAESTPTYNKSNHNLSHHELKKLHRKSDKSSESTVRGRATSTNINSASNGLPRSPAGLPSRQNQNGKASSTITDEKYETDKLNCEPDEVGVAISHDEPTASPPSTAKPNIPPLSPFTQFSTPPHSPFKQKFSQTQSSPLQTSNTHNPPSSFVLSSRPPIPLFSSSDKKRQSLTLLTKIWLQIASLYRRASMPTDARGALSEARTHISTIEAAVIGTHPSAEAFATPGWGGVKSVSELWADALTEEGRLNETLDNPIEAESDYEKALTHFPDHPGAIVGLSTLLLNFYESPSPSPSSQSQPQHDPLPPSSAPASTPLLAPIASSPTPSPESDPSTLIPRLCARDRAYGLLSSLTKSGAGWDCAEAWFALARAYELSGQAAKAREALWWVVELEDNRPVREWSCLEI